MDISFGSQQDRRVSPGGSVVELAAAAVDGRIAGRVVAHKCELTVRATTRTGEGHDQRVASTFEGHDQRVASTFEGHDQRVASTFAFTPGP